MTSDTPAEHPDTPSPEAWDRALQAGMQAQRDFRAERLGNPEWDSDWDDEAEAILEAVWSHIARFERAEEREACARLAEQRGATCPMYVDQLAGSRVPFADLIRARTTP